MVRRILSSFLLLSFLSGCATTTPPQSLQQTVVEENFPEAIDKACSYFYFLWGTQAEYTESYEAALEAYEKALICDPYIDYIKEKIPILLIKMGEQDKASQWLRKAITLEPANDSYRLLLASLAIQQEHFDEAAEIYQEILKHDPQNEAVLLRLGLLYGQLDKTTEAEQIFRKILVSDHNSYFAHLSLARALKEQGKADEATKEYELALKLNWSKELAFEIGYYYHSTKRLEDALRIYTTVTDNDQFDEQGALSRVQLLMDLDRIPEAVDALKAVRTFSDNPHQIDLIYAKILIRQNSIVAARKILEELANHTNLTESRYLLALLIYQESDLQKARDRKSVV
jgi:tetratricopeptide (TPR) repeat protein